MPAGYGSRGRRSASGAAAWSRQIGTTRTVSTPSARISSSAWSRTSGPDRSRSVSSCMIERGAGWAAASEAARAAATARAGIGNRNAWAWVTLRDRRVTRLALIVLLVLAGCGGGDDERRSAPGGPRVETVAEGLEVPWEIAFMPDGRALVTERPGRIRLLDADGSLAAAPLAEVDVSEQGEGGLLGLALDPDFAENALVYLYFTTPTEMKLERWQFQGDATAARDEPDRRHDPGRLDPRLRADRVRARRRPLRRHRRGGPARPGAGPAVAERQVPAPHARPVPRRCDRARRSSRSATATRRASTGSRAPGA